MNLMAVRWCRLYRGTAAELSLEDAIAQLGVPYRNQFPGFLYGVRYFVDFYLPTLGLVIEVDDPSHDRSDKQIADIERTADLEDAWGVTVVRCTNADAIDNPHGTLRRLLTEAHLWPLPQRTPRLASALPEQKKAPQKARREAKSVETRRKRKEK